MAIIAVHVDPPSAKERALADEYFEKSVALFDTLTHRNDVLREAVLNPYAIEMPVLLKAVKDDFPKQIADLKTALFGIAEQLLLT